MTVWGSCFSSDSDVEAHVKQRIMSCVRTQWNLSYNKGNISFIFLSGFISCNQDQAWGIKICLNTT